MSKPMPAVSICCQAMIPDMVAERWGRIIKISSSSAQTGPACQTHVDIDAFSPMTPMKRLDRRKILPPPSPFCPLRMQIILPAIR
jgi:NAD(P)-dependent dehydrogenase (short-subunit alcohol dehydrogenase family)